MNRLDKIEALERELHVERLALVRDALDLQGQPVQVLYTLTDDTRLPDVIGIGAGEIGPDLEESDETENRVRQLDMANGLEQLLALLLGDFDPEIRRGDVAMLTYRTDGAWTRHQAACESTADAGVVADTRPLMLVVYDGHDHPFVISALVAEYADHDQGLLRSVPRHLEQGPVTVLSVATRCEEGDAFMQTVQARLRTGERDLHALVGTHVVESVWHTLDDMLTEHES